MPWQVPIYDRTETDVKAKALPAKDTQLTLLWQALMTEAMKKQL